MLYYGPIAFDVFSRNGDIRPLSEAVVPFAHIEYAYGFGVYETLRAVNGEVRFLEDHAARLLRSAAIIDLRHPFTEAQIREWISALVARVHADSAAGALNIKVLLIGAREPEGCMLIILPLAPLFPEKKLYTKGASAITFEYERLFPQAKTLNMFGSYYAYRKAKEAGGYDALLINRRGCITEGTRTNVFGIRGRTIYSPPMEEILEGVTRKHVLETALQNGFTLEQGDIRADSLASFDGIFLTSTSTKIMPLTRIDDMAFAEVPEALKELMGLYEKRITQ